MLMDDRSGVGQLRKIPWMSGSLKPCTHHLALALYPVSDSFQRRTRREEITLSLCFSLITSACVESMMVTALKSSTPCHSVSIAFENCVCSSAEKVFPGFLVGVPSTEVKFSMQCGRLGRRNRKVSVFLASSDVEVSSLLPCLLDVHRSFTFGRHPSSVSVTLHRLCVVSRRSFLGHAQVESLSQLGYHLQRLCSSVVARTGLLRKHEKGTTDSLVSARLCIFPRGSSVNSRS